MWQVLALITGIAISVGLWMVGIMLWKALFAFLERNDKKA
jgi:hypothetical protein